MAELTEHPIDVAHLAREASRPDCGAVAVFLGTTRDHHEGRRVVRLAYEAYAPMAIAALEKIERAAAERFAIAACRIVHRLGEVPPSEASVVVLATAVHRAAAFDACRWAMDELKRSVPIWKKEIFDDGGAAWVEGAKLE
ncbi:MAG TPA: molybdenum cofactor biosynthesis protein MoaE [Candidatus Saccharimonadaceae bacterium]|nr:molybdenum cofactor biosynthesis protein MoaE [Candidatus Saccharimonadaceae bacterium]